jgi:hypothetical protein
MRTLLGVVRIPLALSVLALAAPSQAGPIGGETILGEFSNPVLQGSVLDPIPPDTGVYDNTSTAFDEIFNSTNGAVGGTPPSQQFGSVLIWGENPGASSLLFFGHPVPADPTTPFDLGTLVFFNGTSALNSLIFGATITFYVGLPQPDAIQPGAEPIGSSTMGIDTTVNNGDLFHDADFLTFTGIANQSLNAFEGASVTAELYGYITGDPVLTLTNIVLDPGQSGNGFIGDGQLTNTPEPTTALLLGTGLLALIGWSARRKVRKST